MDPKYEFNAISRDIKIEMGRSYLTISAQDKIQLFTSLYGLDREVVHDHLLCHLYHKSTDNCWCEYIDLSPERPVVNFLTSLIDLNDNNRLHGDVKTVEQCLVNTRVLISRISLQLGNLTISDLSEVISESIDTSFQQLLNLLVSISNRLCAILRYLKSGPSCQSTPERSLSPVSRKSTSPFLRLSPLNLNQVTSISVMLALISLPTCEALSSQLFCEASINNMDLSNLAINLSASHSTLMEIDASPFISGTERLDEKLYTSYRVPTWEAFTLADNRCTQGGAQPLNVSSENQYNVLLTRFKARQENFIVPVRKALYYEKEKNETFIGGPDADHAFELRADPPTGTLYDIALIQPSQVADQDEAYELISKSFGTSVLSKTDYYLCENTPSNDFDRKFHLKYIKKSVSELITEISYLIKNYLSLKSSINSDSDLSTSTASSSVDDCITVKISISHSPLSVPSSIIEKSNEDDIIPKLQDLTEELTIIKLSIEKVITDHIRPDIDYDFNGNFLNMLAHTDFSESDDVTFFISFILLWIFSISVSFVAYMIPVCKNALARDTLQSISVNNV